MRRIQVPSGRIFNFPTDATDDEIAAFLRAQEQRELVEERSTPRAVADVGVDFGAGVANLVPTALDAIQSDEIPEAATAAGRTRRLMGDTAGDIVEGLTSFGPIGAMEQRAIRTAEMASGALQGAGRTVRGIAEAAPGVIEQSLSATGIPGAALVGKHAGAIGRGIEAVGRFIGGDLQQLRDEENAKRVAEGRKTLEEESQQQVTSRAAAATGEFIDDTADSLRSDYAKAISADMGRAIEGGVASTAEFIASSPGETLSAVLGGSAAMLLPGLAAARAARLAGAGQAAATTAAVQGTGAVVTAQGAEEARDLVMGMGEEELAEVPEYAADRARDLSHEQAQLAVARRAYDAAAGAGAVLNAATGAAAQRLGLAPVEQIFAGGGRVPGVGRAMGAVGAAAREVPGEGLQGAGEALGQNLGGVAAGTIEGRDAFDGVGANALLEAAAGGGTGFAVGLVSPQEAAIDRAKIPTELSAPERQGVEDVRAIFEQARAREAGPAADRAPLAAEPRIDAPATFDEGPAVDPAATPPAPDPAASAQAITAAPPDVAPDAIAAPAPVPAPAQQQPAAQPVDDLEARLMDRGLSPVVRPSADPEGQAAAAALQRQADRAAWRPGASTPAAPGAPQSRAPAWSAPEVQDAPNFGMPEPERTLPDNSPLLRPRDADQSPERVQLRETLIQQRVAGRPSVPAGQQPVAYVMGGGGASGKGRVIQFLEERGEINPQQFVYIDADSFKAGDDRLGVDGSPEYPQIIAAGDKRAAAVTHEESSALAKETLRRATTARQNVVLDRTLGDPEKAKAELSALRRAGYRIELVGVTVDPREAIARSVSRSTGPKGRYVPLDALLKAHKGFSRGFPFIQSLADRVRLYDNNVPAGADPRLIASRRDGESSIAVRDNLAYNDFVEKGRINDAATTYREIGYESQVLDAGGDRRGGRAAGFGRDVPQEEPGRLAQGARGVRGQREQAAALPAVDGRRPQGGGGVREGEGAAGPERAQSRVAPPAEVGAPAAGRAIDTVVARALAAIGLQPDAAVVVDSPAQLPRSVLRSGLDGRTEGIYDVETGKVYLFRGALTSPSRAVWVAMHELAGHKGLRALMKPADFARTLDRAGTNPLIAGIARAIEAEARADAQAGAEGARAIDPALFLEEALAETAAAYMTGDFDGLFARYGDGIADVRAEAEAQRDAMGFIRRMIADIKRALFNIGAPMSDAEVVGLIGNAYKALRAGAAPQTADAGAAQSRGQSQAPDGASPESRGINVEVAPDPRNEDLKARFGALSEAERAQVSRELGAAYIPRVMAEMGITGFEVEHTVGGFAGDTNPSIIVRMPQPASFEAIVEAGKVLGTVFSQQAIIAYDESQQGSTGFVKVRPIDGALDYQQQADLFRRVYTAFPEAAGFTGREGSLVFGNFTSMPNAEFHNRIDAALASIPGRYDSALLEFRSDWIEPVTLEGTRYASGPQDARSGRDGVRGRGGADAISAIRRDFDADFERAVEQRALKSAGAGSDGQPGVRRDDAREAPAGLLQSRAASAGQRRVRGPAPAGGARVSPFPADAPAFAQRRVQRDAVAAQGVHYSGTPGLTSLDGKFAGAGSAGGERRRFGSGQFGERAPAGDTARRLYFYVQQGDIAPRPEDAVAGRERYAVNLTNLYDIEADPRGLREEAGINDDYLEELVNEAGFDGILFPPVPGIPERTAVLFGLRKKVPVVSAPLQSRAPLQSSAAKDARHTAATLRARKSQLASMLAAASTRNDQLKAWTQRARTLIGEVATSRDFAQEIVDAKRDLAPERRDTLRGDREALKRYDEIRDMIGDLELNQRAVRAKAQEANRLLDKIERREGGLTIAERDEFIAQLGDSLDQAERAYLAAKAIADWRSRNDYAVIKAFKKRTETLNFLASEGYQQGSFPWHEGNLLQFKDTRMRKLRRVMQDRFIDLRDIQQQIEREVGHTLDDLQNVYRMENQMHGKVADRIDGFHQKLRDPLIEAINRSGLHLRQVEQYLWAKHAGERNDAIAKIRPGVADGSGMTTDEAAEILATFTPQQTRQLEAIGRRVEEIRRFSIQTMVESGQLDRDGADRLLRSYQHYVPLRGKDGEGEERVGGTGTGQGISAGSSGVTRALGRKTPPKNILAELVGDAERSIVQAGKAEVGRSLLRLALSYPNENLWEVQPVELRPQFNEATGEVFLSVVSTGRDADSIIVKHNGKPYRVSIRHPQLRDALRNTGLEGTEWVVRYVGAVNRWLSAVFTRYNPGFVPVNLFRDLTLGITGIGAELGAGSAAKIMGMYRASFAASYRQAREQRGDSAVPDAQKTMDDWTREAAEAGMKSGWTALDDMDTLQQRIEDSMAGVGVIAKTGVTGVDAAATYLKMAKDKVGEGFKWIDDVNDGVENGLRLATYIHLRRDKGWSKAKAAEYAKEMTVNFNRRGMAGSLINSLYLFYNAAVQGSRRTLRIMRHPTTLGVLGGLATTQAMLAVTFGAAKFGDEDDETLWEKIPDHVKRRSLVIPMGFADDGSARYVSIPMPFGFNVFPAVAGYFANYANPNWVAKQGDALQQAAAATGYVTSVAIDAVSPVAIGEDHAMWPTLVQMGLQLAANRDSLGRTLAPSEAFNRYDAPRAEMYKPGTFDGYVWAARALNRLGGGDEYNAPKILPGILDVSPNDIEFLVGQFLGGPGTILNQSWRMGAIAAAGEDVKVSDIPIVRSFAAEQRPEMAEVRSFYDNADSIERGLERMRDAYVEGGKEAFLQTQAELGPLFKDVTLAIRERTTENGATGEVMVNPRTGRPEIEAAEGTMLREYRDARKTLSDISAEQRRVFNDSGMTRIERQAELLRLNREKGDAVRDLNRIANALRKSGLPVE